MTKVPLTVILAVATPLPVRSEMGPGEGGPPLATVDDILVRGSR